MKTFAQRSARDNKRALNRATEILSHLTPENFSAFRSEVYDIGFQLEKLESLREAERERGRQETKRLNELLQPSVSTLSL